MNKKICIVAPVHIWDDVRIFKKQAVSLTELESDVYLLARATKSFKQNKVHIVPINARYSNRLQRFLSLPKIAIQALNIKADIYHLHNPDTIILAWILILFRKEVIYDTHEDFAVRILARDWIPRCLRPSVAWLISVAEILTARYAGGAIATQEDVVSRLGNKCILVRNAPRVDRELIDYVESLTEEIKPKHEVLRLVYLGAISNSRGLVEMIEALFIINKENNISCRLWLIGSSHNYDLEEARNMSGWRYVDYLPQMEQEKAFAYLASSDVGLVYLNDVADHRKADANKTYEYMTFGIPFIASDFPLWREHLEASGGGLFVTPGSSKLLAKAIIECYHYDEEKKLKIRESGEIFLKNYNWNLEKIKLFELYEKLLF